MTDRQLGDWIVTRTIVDVAGGEALSCVGRANLMHDGGRIRYDEAVTFLLGNRPMHATRTYFYRCINDVIIATFADGRAFFTAGLRADGTATAIHYCGPDVYTGTLCLATAEWRTRWDVSGSKALRIATRYTREG